MIFTVMIAEWGSGLSNLANPAGRLRFVEDWLLWFVMPCQGKSEAGTSECEVRNEVRKTGTQVRKNGTQSGTQKTKCVPAKSPSDLVVRKKVRSKKLMRFPARFPLTGKFPLETWYAHCAVNCELRSL